MGAREGGETMGCSSAGIEGALKDHTRGRCSLSLDDVNDGRAEGSDVCAGEALAYLFWARCHDRGDGRGVVDIGCQVSKEWEGC